MAWLKFFTFFKSRKIKSRKSYQDCRFQKLANVIYHMIMRQGSNLQEFNLKLDKSVVGAEIFHFYYL